MRSLPIVTAQWSGIHRRDNAAACQALLKVCQAVENDFTLEVQWVRTRESGTRGNCGL